LPAFVSYVLVSIVGWYVNGFIVKPNELVRERPYIAPQHRDDQAGVRPGSHHASFVPRRPGTEAIDAANNHAHARQPSLWDWRALQDTLRQIQAILRITNSRTSTSIGTTSAAPYAR
jgi:uncharacterized membrane protein (UPF0182 family)